MLGYWFGEAWDDPAAIAGRGALWWGGREHDAPIRERFGELVAAAERGELERWADTARGALALVILVDQFRRNIHRGRPEAFADDARALAICLQLQEDGRERELPPIARVFLHMPMQHAEDPAVQERSVAVFEALAEEAGEAYAGFAEYARQHRDIVLRYGRFPHRNAILGREPTAEEAAYLEGGGATFGQ